MLALVPVSSWEMPESCLCLASNTRASLFWSFDVLHPGRAFPWQLIDGMFIYWVAGNDSCSNWHFRFFFLLCSPGKICLSWWKWQQRLPFYLSGPLTAKVNSRLIWCSYSMKDCFMGVGECLQWAVAGKEMICTVKSKFRFYSLENDLATAFRLSKFTENSLKASKFHVTRLYAYWSLHW